MNYTHDKLCIERHNLNLIINADDFGYGELRDRGIIQLIKKKRCSSISLMVNGPNIHNFEIQIQQNLKTNQFASLSIGLHLNLTQGQSVSKQQIGVLTKNKKFLGKPEFYQKISQQQFVFPQQLIKRQIQSQIAQFIRIVGVRPAHIDGHNHIHVIPQMAQILADIMVRFGIYRTRLPIEKLTKHSSFNQIFVKNAKISKKIFDANKIIYPSKFIGLQLIHDFSINSLQNSIKQIESTVSIDQQVFIELMCHPGYSDSDSTQTFSQSKDRQKQKQILLSKQLQNILNYKIGSLKSFQELESSQNKRKQGKRLMIYSKMMIGSGNYTTTLRYKRIFEELGFQVFLRSIQTNINFQQQVDDLKKFLYYFKISLILGVNITNCARQIYYATVSESEILYRVPYILIIAGTDANVVLKQKSAQVKFKQPIQSALCLVSMSADMTQTVQKCLSSCKISKQIVDIEQSIQIIKRNLSIDAAILQKYKLQKKKFIIFPTSFRKVKAVDHLIQQLNIIQKQYQISTIIAGPVLDATYFKQTRPKLQSIRYIGSIPKQQIEVLIRNSLILINTSESQGMCCSILEAFQSRTLVVARRNQGNCNLIKNQYNGFLYEKPAQFLQIFKKYIIGLNFHSQNQIKVQNAYELIKKRFSYNLQKQRYQQLLQQYYFSRFQTIQLFKNAEKVRLQLFNADQVHPASNLNSQLYQSIKQARKNLKYNQCVLDLAAGTGIMGLIYTKMFDCLKGQITFSDYSNKVLGACLFNWRINSDHSDPVKVIFAKSDMFKSLPKNYYDTILTCLPQTPFQLKQSRPDKNGGPDAVKFNFQLIKEWRAHSASQQSRLFMFYSYMCWPTQFFELIKKYKSIIQWRSFRKNYCIAAQAYDKMEEGLSQYIKIHAKQGRAEIQFNGTQFIVPAEMLLIKAQIQK